MPGLINYASSYDLRLSAGQILDQGNEGSCVENAVVSSIDMLMRLAGHPIDALSRQQLYNDQRQLIGHFDTDWGSGTEATLFVGKNTGIAYERSFAYGPDTLFTHPSATVEAEASQHKITSYTQLNPSVSYVGFVAETKQALSQGKTVLCSFHVHDFIFNETGPLAGQINYGFTGTNNSGHCVVIVGVDDNLNGGSYIIKNSWGTGWGDNGYGTIRYDQFAVSATHDDLESLWVINGFNGIDTTFTTQRVVAATDYAVALHRAGEITGVDYFASKMSILSNAQLLDGMISSAEGVKLYAGLTDTQFVESCYGSILGRHSDAGGLTAWTNLMISQHLSRGTLMDDLLNTVTNMTIDIGSHDYLIDISNIASYMSIAMQYIGNKDTLTAHELTLVTNDVNHTEILKIGIQHDFGII